MIWLLYIAAYLSAGALASGYVSHREPWVELDKEAQSMCFVLWPIVMLIISSDVFRDILAKRKGTDNGK